MRRTRALALVAISVFALGAPAVTAAASAPRDHYASHPIRVMGVYASATPRGLSPQTIKDVYFFGSLGTGAGKTIAIVDAYDDPTAESDLDHFSQYYGLGACNSTSCFEKVDQTGHQSYPRTDGGWALEISLDVQWAHAIAPGAKILLVEANSNSFANLLAAEDYAAAHADYVSNSWGSSEFSSESDYDVHFVHTGVTFFASSGDGGAQSYPSTSPNVISVGGTTLSFYPRSTTFKSETGWSGSGGGCSAYESKNASQPTGLCTGDKRATPDVSLDADPNSGVSVYDTTRYLGSTGWWQVGGTSASSPMTAGHAAAKGVSGDAAYLYGLASSAFRDIIAGSNNVGSCGPGYDLVTGRGSWLG